MFYFADRLTVVIQILIFYLITIEVALATITVDNKTCLLNVYKISDDTSKTLLWDGRALLKHCRVGFSVPDKSVYKFVIETEEYKVVDCDFTLSYFYGDTTVPRQKYTCTSTPGYYTTEGVPHIILQFDTSRSSLSTVRLHISAQCSNFVIGGTVGSVSFVILITLIIYIIRRRNHQRCDLIDDCYDGCCECGHHVADVCGREARNTFFYFCSDCDCCDCFSASVTEPPMPENIPRTGTETVQALSPRRSSIDSISTNPGSLHIVMEEQTMLPLPTSFDPPPYEPPPPSYDDYIRGVPPPCYPE